MRLRPECKNGGSSPFQSWDIETQKFGPKKKWEWYPLYPEVTPLMQMNS